MFSHLTLASSILYLYLIYTNNILLKYVFKPATTMLIIGVALQSGSKIQKNVKITGLLFSLLGDIFLMFEGEQYFILGLSSFLCAHVFYIYMFYNTKQKEQSSILLVLLSVAAAYYSFLYQSIYEQGGYVMMIAVLIYVVVITFMVYYAILNYNTNLTIGVFLFFISDATIALDKFLMNAVDRRYEYVVMVTYYLAQFCIARYY